MRHIAVLALLIALTACATHPPERSAELEAKARRGDASAQMAMGDSYCYATAAQSDASKVLYWWKQAAQSNETDVSWHANMTLGSYYLGQFVNLGFYQPGKSKPIAMCRSDMKVKPDYAQAEKYFRRCAKIDYHDQSCTLALGHLNIHRGDDAKAYFWYAAFLAYFLDNDLNNVVNYPKQNEVLRLDHPGIADIKMLTFIKKLASRLPPAQVKKLNAEAQAFIRSRKRP